MNSLYYVFTYLLQEAIAKINKYMKINGNN